MKYIDKYIYDENYIGKGTFSKVYIGYEKNIKEKKYAIKKIYKKSDPKYAKYVKYEIEIMNKLKHKNIITLYDTIYTEKYVFLVLELCDTDLNNYIQNNVINEQDTKFIIRQIIEAIKYIMDNNIVHRDLKPHNILINKDTKEIKICDFGFAKEFKDTLLTDTVCGSPLYMAPELLKNQKYNIKSDIWSLGIIMYEIVMKNHPFKSNNITDLIYRIQNDKPILTNSNFSQGCKELINNLLIVDYTKRLEWSEIFSNKWLYETDNNSKPEKIDIYMPNTSFNSDGDMYLEDIYNSIELNSEFGNITNTNKISNENINNENVNNENVNNENMYNTDTNDSDDENIIDIENVGDNLRTPITDCINTPISTPINIKPNIVNEYIFVNKPDEKSVIHTIMDNSNEIIKKFKNLI